MNYFHLSVLKHEFTLSWAINALDIQQPYVPDMSKTGCHLADWLWKKSSARYSNSLEREEGGWLVGEKGGLELRLDERGG